MLEHALALSTTLQLFAGYEGTLKYCCFNLGWNLFGIAGASKGIAFKRLAW